MRSSTTASSSESAERSGLGTDSTDVNAPFGGYKQSGNGREWGKEGLKEFLEVKAMMGYSAA